MLNLEKNLIFKFVQLHWLQLISCPWRTVSFIVWKGSLYTRAAWLEDVGNLPWWAPSLQKWVLELPLLWQRCNFCLISGYSQSKGCTNSDSSSFLTGIKTFKFVRKGGFLHNLKNNPKANQPKKPPNIKISCLYLTLQRILICRSSEGRFWI